MFSYTFRDGDLVVELFCGDGSFIDLMGEDICKVEYIGMDNCRESLKTAASFYSASKISFKYSNPAKTALPRCYADWVIINGSNLDRITNKIYEEATRIAKPNGKIILSLLEPM